MTTGDLCGYVVGKWINGHAPASIDMYLVCLGQPATKHDVMKIIRAYVDLSTENKGLSKRVR
jgi:hypothetical protein